MNSMAQNNAWLDSRKGWGTTERLVNRHAICSSLRCCSPWTHHWFEQSRSDITFRRSGRMKFTLAKNGRCSERRPETIHRFANDRNRDRKGLLNELQWRVADLLEYSCLPVQSRCQPAYLYVRGNAAFGTICRWQHSVGVRIKRTSKLRLSEHETLDAILPCRIPSRVDSRRVA